MAILLVIIGTLSRIVPHSMNFTPIIGITLFSVYYFKSYWKFLVPFLAILGSDLILEISRGAGQGFHSGTPIVYFSYLIIAIIAFFLLKKLNFGNLLITTLSASLSFFLITNFAFFYPSPDAPVNGFSGYTHDWAGILASYTAGIPFFRSALIGDLLFTGVLFGIYALAHKAIGFKSETN